MNIKNIFKKWFGNVTECILCLIAAVVAVGVTFIVYEQDTGAPTPREMTVLQNDTLQFSNFRDWTINCIISATRRLSCPNRHL